MPSGEWLESTTPISGMPSFLASATAILWKPTSITKMASGRRSCPGCRRCPSRASISRWNISCSFLLIASRPASCWAFMSFRRLIEVLTVLKLVSMPPSQRWSTKGTPARGLRRHDLAGLALGAHHQDGAAVGRQLLHELGRLLEHRQRLFQVDDVDLVAVAEDERGHLGVPEAGLVSEMDTGFQHFAHGDWHESSEGWV
jgi:hypothetical protein